MKNSGINWIGSIPDEWSIVRNKNVFHCCKNIVGKRSSQLQLLSLTTQGIKKKDIHNTEGKLPESFDTYQQVHQNDLVMCLFDLDCSAVFSGLSRFDGMISPAYRVLSCKENILPEYADYWFQYVGDKRKFNHYSKNIRYTLSYEDFSVLPILLPPLLIQRRITNYLSCRCAAIEHAIYKEKESIEKLEEYKLSCITEAVTKGLNPTVPMKDSGSKWIGNVPSDTQVIPAKRLYQIILGKMLCSTPKKTSDTLEKYLCAANIHFSGIDYNNLKHMWFSQQERNSYCIQNGDLLVVEGGAGAGGAYIVKDLSEPLYIQNSIMITRPKSTVSNKWLYYTLYSLVHRQYIDYVCNKATIPHFTKEKLGGVPVVIFPHQKEQQILSILEKQTKVIDYQIQLKQELIDKLTEYKKSLIYEVVTGKKEV